MCTSGVLAVVSTIEPKVIIRTMFHEVHLAGCLIALSSRLHWKVCERASPALIKHTTCVAN